MGHIAKGLSRNRYRNKERSLFAYDERQRISVFSACEKPEAMGRTFVTLSYLVRASIQIL